jgi:type II secretory pathway component PulF
MPRFTYSGRDRAGGGASGEIEAPSRRDALRLLVARGLTVSRVDEAEARGTRGRPTPAATRAGSSLRLGGSTTTPGRRERLPFLVALEDLTSSGLSAGEALRLLSLRIKEPRLRQLCGRLWERVGEGASLSAAMATMPEVFDASTQNLIQAGEATGSLNEVLKRLIAHLTEQRDLQRQLASALAYPLFMMVVAGGVILFFLFFLLPRLQTLLSSLGGELPMSTQILVSVSEFALRYGVVIAGAAVFGAIAAWRWYQTEVGRAAADALLLRFPPTRAFAVSRTVLAISQTLSVLLENGITTAEALRMTGRQITNRVHRAAFDDATGRILEGESLSNAWSRTHCFPDLVLDQLAVGENTGNVVPALKKVTAAYQDRITRHLHLFTRVIASAVLLTVFAFVGFIAYAIVSAVFQLSASFQM